MYRIIFECVRIVFVVLMIMIFMLLCLRVFHHLIMKKEKRYIIPNGKMICVNGRKIHVYLEGKQSNRLTLVFLSGSATVAPVYDFKSIYGRLSDRYKIAVIEKPGYGYSDITDIDRSITSMVMEERNALVGAGGCGPYILISHSMGGLEAIYWAQNYPDEVQGIIGLDMAVPEVYEKMNIKASLRMMKLLKIVCFLGIQRIPGLYPLNTEELNEDEKKQQKLLLYHYYMNQNFCSESERVMENAEIVINGGHIHLPLLMFTSNGSEIGDFWIPCERKFAEENHGKIIQFNCGHYIHHYESEAIVNKIEKFMLEFYEYDISDQ